ncbi:MAG: hypothetical protein ACRENG_33650 [bacterium]
MNTFTKPLATSPFVMNLRIWESLPVFGLDLVFEENLLGANLLLQNRVADASAVALHEFLNDFPSF